jgi:hypothetical protein
MSINFRTIINNYNFYFINKKINNFLKFFFGFFTGLLDIQSLNYLYILNIKQPV